MQVIHRNGIKGLRDKRAGWRAWGAALLMAGVAAACDPAEQGGVEPVAKAEVSAAADGGSVLASAGASATAVDPSVPAAAAEEAANPLGGLVPPAPGQAPLVGVVAEHLPAGGYNYLRVEPEHGEARWVVTMQRDVGSGDRVRVDSLGSRHDFYSRRLDRRFAELVFGVVKVVG